MKTRARRILAGEIICSEDRLNLAADVNAIAEEQRHRLWEPGEAPILEARVALKMGSINRGRGGSTSVTGRMA
jgi:hypothetical protein